MINTMNSQLFWLAFILPLPSQLNATTIATAIIMPNMDTYISIVADKTDAIGTTTAVKTTIIIVGIHLIGHWDTLLDTVTNPPIW